MENKATDSSPETKLHCKPQRGYAQASVAARGFSLLENVIALSLFSLLAVGISGLLIQSHRIAENNRLRQRAYAVAQGYLEQIQTLPAYELQRALESPATVPLLPVWLNDFNTGTTFRSDPIFLHGAAPPLEGATKGSNHRKVLLYRDNSSVESPEQAMNTYMDIWLDFSVQRCAHQAQAFEIVVRFAWHPRGNNTYQYGELRTLKTDLSM